MISLLVFPHTVLLTYICRPKDDSSVFVMDPITSQCVYYESVVSFPRKHRIEISPEIFENRPQIEFRNDLIDPYLDICSFEVPALFTENFDWQRLRSDFVHGILTSDILGKTIYTKLVVEPYVDLKKLGNKLEGVAAYESHKQ